MDLELDLDEDLLATVQRLASGAGVTPEEWARRAIRGYLGLPVGPAEARDRPIVESTLPE